MNKVRSIIFVCAAASLEFVSSLAHAQDPPAPASESPPPLATLPPASAPLAAPSPAAAASSPALEKEASDQENVVGHFGVTYFGVQAIPIATPSGASTTLNAPFVGARYWISRSVGVDVGLGFAYGASVVDTSSNGQTTSIAAPATVAGGVHFGIPLALARRRHFAFEVIPEITVGFASASVEGQNNQAGVGLTGARIDIGARVGGEIFFGFMGVPQLSLQASIGAGARRLAWNAQALDNSASSGGAQVQVATTVDTTPWAIFTNNVAAVYYF